MKKKELGIIGGGQMAEAIIKGILVKNFLKPSEIFVSEPVKERRTYLEKTYKIKTTANNLEVVKKKRIILIAVKPQVVKNVLEEVKDYVVETEHIFITIAAGLPLEYYEKYFPPKTKVIRVMPNICAMCLQSMSAICANKFVSEKELQIALDLFSCVGEVLLVKEELMDGITALSGSGPAYIALLIEAFIDAGVRIGISRDLAKKLILQTIIGTVSLFKEGKNPYEIKAMVSSPGGTTISGLHFLYEKGVPGIIMSAIEKTFKRSKELKE